MRVLHYQGNWVMCTLKLWVIDLGLLAGKQLLVRYCKVAGDEKWRKSHAQKMAPVQRWAFFLTWDAYASRKIAENDNQQKTIFSIINLKPVCRNNVWNLWRKMVRLLTLWKIGIVWNNARYRDHEIKNYNSCSNILLLGKDQKSWSLLLFILVNYK